MKIIKATFFLLLFPTVIFAQPSAPLKGKDVSLWPAKVHVPTEIKAGKNYQLEPDLRVWNNMDQPVHVRTSVVEFRNQDRMFNPSHVRVTPKRATIRPNGSKDFTVHLKVRKKFTPGEYQSVVVFSPEIAEGETQTQIKKELGSKITYSVSRRLSPLERAKGWLTKNSQKGKATVAETKVPAKITIGVLSLAVAYLLADKFSRRA